MHEVFGISPSLAVALCFGITFFVNFFSTKYFVYRSAGPIMREFASYAATNLMFRAGEYACFSFLYLVAGIRYFIANFAVISGSLVLKFLVYNFLVYANRTSPHVESRSGGN
jgi:putative flippase GtrA